MLYAVELAGWVVGAFVTLALGGYALAAVVKAAVRPVWGAAFGLEEGTLSREVYRGAIRSIPTGLGLVVGSAEWVASLLLDPDAARIFAYWPQGLTPLAGSVLGLGAGGLSLRIHEAVDSNLDFGFRSLFGAVADRVRGGARPGPTPAVIHNGEPPRSDTLGPEIDEGDA